MPYRESYYDFYYYLPAGIAYLSQALISQNIPHDVFDMQLEPRIEILLNKIEESNPMFIGFSMMTFRYLDNYELIKKVKERFPAKMIVIGGPHASTFKESIFEDCPSADIVVPLEGEEIVIELCQDKDLSKIEGIIYKTDNKIICNPPRPYIEDFQKYGFPKYQKFDLSQYKQKSIPIISSRGCPYSCIYCPVSTTIGKKWRPRKSADIIDELEFWANHPDVSEIQIVDDNFTLIRQRVVEICEYIKKRQLSQKLNISLGNGIRADKVDLELLRLMKDSGFKVLAFGVESGSESILKTLKKGESLKEIDQAINWACLLDFEVHLFFVLGAPGETESDVLESIKFSKKYPVTDIAFYHLIPFPGTELNRWVSEHHCFAFKSPEFLNDASHWINTPLFSTPELSILKRRELYKKANEEGQSFTAKVRLKRISKKLQMKTKLPAPLLYTGLKIFSYLKQQKQLAPIIKSLREKILN